MMALNIRLKLCGKTYFAPLILLVFLVVLKVLTGLPFYYFTRDPSDTVGHPFYLGLYSNLTMVAWGLAAATMWFSWSILRRDRAQEQVVRFLFVSALVTSILYLDDFFLVHERVCPDYLGIPEILVLLVYATGISAFLLRSLSVIRRTDSTILISALALFAISVIIDVQPWVRLPGHHFWEDGTKFLGVVGWGAYYFRFAAQMISGRPSPGDIPV